MTKSRSAQGWIELDPEVGVWCYHYTFKAPDGHSTTFAVRCAEGQLLVISPGVGVSDAVMDELASWGEVGYLLAPNGFHHLGIASWRRRFPNARVFAPAAAVPRIAKQNPDAGAFETLEAMMPLLDEHVHVHEVPHTKCGEIWCRVRGPKGYTWFVSDILANIEALPKNFLLKALFKWTGSAPGFRVFNLALQFIVKDKRAVLRALLEDMRRHEPVCIVPSHGAVLDRSTVWADTQALVEAKI